MKSPYTGNEMLLKSEPREFVFRKDKITIQFNFFLCPDTGEEFETQEQSELNHAQVVNQYRASHHLPFPDEITAIREKYGLSARLMSQILGFGINQYSLYEQGEVPSVSNGINIALASSPQAFEQLLTRCSELSETTKAKVLHRVIEEKQKQPDLFEQLIPFQNPGIINGFRRFDISRFINTVIYMSAKVSPYKVKMNKLLYYSDFAHYKYYGRGITGLSYEAIKMGPVPENYQLLYSLFKAENTFSIEEIWFDETQTSGEKFSADIGSFKPDLFSKSELKIIDEIADKFRNTSTSEIINLSHDEKGWKENITQNKMIPYSAAMQLIHC